MKLFGIGYISRETTCPIETIRYYEKIGLLSPPRRKESGHRRYCEEDIKHLDFILHARSLGFSIEDIRELICLVKTGTACEEIRQVTMRHLDVVKKRIIDLKHMADILEKAALKCSGGKDPECHIVEMLYETRSQTGSRH